MTQSPLLLIHAGMRPGELIIAHADGSFPIFLPPTDRVHRFEVAKNSQQEEWALLRRYVSGGDPDALVIFQNEPDAHRALQELHKALLEPAPGPDTRKISIGLPENWRPIGAAILFLAGIMALAYCGKRPEQANTSSAPVSNTSGYSVSGPVPPAETNPAASPAGASDALSPGDAILQQIQQPAPANAPAAAPATTQQAPQEAPASAGDALLQQIKGG